MPVPMIVLLPMAMKMDMRAVIVVVAVDVPSFPVQFPRQCPAKRDQQKSHTGLSDDFKPFRDTNVPRQNHCPDEQERRRMADPPPEPNSTGCPKRGPFSEHSRDRRKMIGIERMPSPSKNPNPRIAA